MPNKFGLSDEQMKRWDEVAALRHKTGEQLIEWGLACQKEFFKDGEEAAVQKILNGLTEQGQPFWIAPEK